MTKVYDSEYVVIMMAGDKCVVSKKMFIIEDVTNKIALSTLVSYEDDDRSFGSKLLSGLFGFTFLGWFGFLLGRTYLAGRQTTYYFVVVLSSGETLYVKTTDTSLAKFLLEKGLDE